MEKIFDELEKYDSEQVELINEFNCLDENFYILINLNVSNVLNKISFIEMYKED